MYEPIFVIILAGMAMIGAFATDTFLPSFPSIAAEFGLSQAAVQLSLSIYLLCYATMCLLYGPLSDALGRRKVVIASLAAFLISSAAAVFAPNFTWLLVCRALQGFSAGGGMVVGQTMVRDRFSGAIAHRLMSQIMTVFGIAPAVAPILGGFLHAHFGWRSTFVFMTVFSGSLLLASLRWLKETHNEDQRTQFHLVTLLKDYWLIAKVPALPVSCLAVAALFGCIGLYISSSAAFVIGILRLPETAFGWLFVPMIGGMVVGAGIGGRLAHRLKRRSIVAIGFGTVAAASVINVMYNLTATASVPLTVMPLALLTLGIGIVMPIMSVGILDILPKKRGLAASMMNFTQMAVFAFISAGLAPVLFHSATALALGAAGLAILSAVLWAVGERLAERHEFHDAHALRGQENYEQTEVQGT